MARSRFLSWDTIMADGKLARKQNHVSEKTVNPYPHEPHEGGRGVSKPQ